MYSAFSSDDPQTYSSDTVVFWATTVLCALGAMIFPLAG